MSTEHVPLQSQYQLKQTATDTPILLHGGFQSIQSPENFPQPTPAPQPPSPIFKGITDCGCVYRIDLRFVQSVIVGGTFTRVYIQDADEPAFILDGELGDKFVEAYDAYHGVR
jgi:hypothetical protein